ncbi:MAG: hypothetical protein AABZ83_12930, partial [candidate division NC10 bacterium]
MRATVTPELGPIEVRVQWSLVVPPRRSGAAVEQDLYLLWPGPVDGETVGGAPDPVLARYLTERGFTVIRQGRLPLDARQLWGGGRRPPPEPIEGGAPFASYVREAGTLDRSATATWIRVPWTPKLVNRTWLIELRMKLPQLILERRASWLENTIWGRRYSIALSFGDVRTRAAFPVYFEHRDRVVHLATDPSQLLIRFEDSDHLKIHAVSPPTSRRQAGETRAGRELVSLYLDPAEGLRPQVLSVEFGYFTGWKSWAPVLFAALFFVLGNLAGPLIAMLARRAGTRLAGRIHFGPRPSVGRQTGTVIPREALARIEPGTTTHEEVLRLCGPDPEEHEQLAMPERRILVYRGRKVVPQRRRRLWWLATVSRWDAEHH